MKIRKLPGGSPWKNAILSSRTSWTTLCRSCATLAENELLKDLRLARYAVFWRILAYLRCFTCQTISMIDMIVRAYAG